MSGSGLAGPDAGAWFVEADHISVTALARRRARARLEGGLAKSRRIAIVSSLFFVLIAAGLLIGGHAAIDPILQSTAAERESQGLGAVVYMMPDGIYCRHMSFDNVTAQVTEGAMGHCQGDVGWERPEGTRPFSWRTN
jgi:hypothetical protein